MRTAGAAAWVTACVIAGGAVAATPGPSGRTASVSSSSTRAGTSPIALTFRLHYEMQCGTPGRGPVTIVLPAQMTAPAKIARTAVLLDAKPPQSVSVDASRIVIGIPPRTGVICDVIGPGTLTIVLEKQAGIGNPKAPGSYVLPVSVGTQSFRATLTVR